MSFSNSDSDSDSIIETEAFKKHKKQKLIFEYSQNSMHKILKTQPDSIDEKLKNCKKDELKSIAKKIRKSINVSLIKKLTKNTY